MLSTNLIKRRMGALVLVVMVLPFHSCTKYLDKKPDAALTVPSTLPDLQALLDYSDVMNVGQSPSFGEASCDDYFLTDQSYSSLPITIQAVYTWNRPAYNYQNDWGRGYGPVYQANFCLEALGKIPVDASNVAAWNNVKGSAHFYRAYNFLNLLGVFANAFDSVRSATDLGIVLRTASDFNVPSVRSVVRDCYQQVLLDAKASVRYLPVRPITTMRPSRPAAYGLLARAYLSMHAYDTAYLYADSCLQLQSALMDYNGDQGMDPTAMGSSPFAPFNKETIFYTVMNSYLSLHLPYYANVDTTLFGLYAPGDLRARAYFYLQGPYATYTGSYTSRYGDYFTGLSTDEMFLIRAESAARLGRVSESLNDLNTLLSKRWTNQLPYLPVSAASVAEAVDLVLLERRKELCMRGLRWVDIKRLNAEGRNITLKRHINGQEYTLLPNSKYYALPLPADIITQTGIPQN